MSAKVDWYIQASPIPHNVFLCQAILWDGQTLQPKGNRAFHLSRKRRNGGVQPSFTHHTMHKPVLGGIVCKKEDHKQAQRIFLPVTLLYQAGNDKILQPGPVGGG